MLKRVYTWLVLILIEKVRGFQKDTELARNCRVFMIATLMSEIQTKAKYHKPFKLLFSSGSHR